MSALDKVLLAGGGVTRHQAPSDPAADLVTAALSVLTDLHVFLAADDSDDDGDDGKGDGKAGGSHAGHPTYKKLVAKGMNPKMAAAMCAKADNKVAAAGLCEAAIITLCGLETSAEDWVERTAYDPVSVALADSSGSAKKPYGNVTYADPGYQADGKKRYPVDTEEHVRAALSYINQSKNAAKYGSNLGKVKAAIYRAARKFGIEVSDSSEKVAASYVSLAAKMTAGVAMHHAPMTGMHSHAHSVSATHDHPHQHYGDNDHGSMAHQPGGTKGASMMGWGG